MATAKTPEPPTPEPTPAPVEVSRETEAETETVRPAPVTPCEHGCGAVHPVPADATGFACEHGSWTRDGDSWALSA